MCSLFRLLFYLNFITTLMYITGKIHEVHTTQQVSETFKKRTFVVEYAENPQYPELIFFELIQDRCPLLDDFTAGQTVTVHFNLKGRKWISPSKETRYFNTLQAWKIELAANAPSASGSASPTKTESETLDLEDELPF